MQAQVAQMQAKQAPSQQPQLQRSGPGTGKAAASPKPMQNVLQSQSSSPEPTSQMPLVKIKQEAPSVPAVPQAPSQVRVIDIVRRDIKTLHRDLSDFGEMFGEFLRISSTAGIVSYASLAIFLFGHWIWFWNLYL